MAEKQQLSILQQQLNDASLFDYDIQDYDKLWQVFSQCKSYKYP